MFAGCLGLGVFRIRRGVGLGCEIGNKYELSSGVKLDIVSRRREDRSAARPLSHLDRKVRNSHHLSWLYGGRSFGVTRFEIDGGRRLAYTPHVVPATLS